MRVEGLRQCQREQELLMRLYQGKIGNMILNHNNLDSDQQQPLMPPPQQPLTIHSSMFAPRRRGRRPKEYFAEIQSLY